MSASRTHTHTNTTCVLCLPPPIATYRHTHMSDMLPETRARFGRAAARPPRDDGVCDASERELSI